MSDKECNLIGDYLYHINVDMASGEYALNALLVPITSSKHPGVYAREPLTPLLLEGDQSAIKHIPIVILYSDRDWMYHPEVNDIVRKRPNTELKFVANSGHHLYIDNPEECNAALKQACFN